MNSDDDRAIELIKGMLDDQNKEVVQNAVISLYNLLGDDILDDIISSEEYSEKAKSEALKLQDDLREENEEEATFDE